MSTFTRVKNSLSRVLPRILMFVVSVAVILLPGTILGFSAYHLIEPWLAGDILRSQRLQAELENTGERMLELNGENQLTLSTSGFATITLISAEPFSLYRIGSSSVFRMVSQLNATEEEHHQLMPNAQLYETITAELSSGQYTIEANNAHMLLFLEGDNSELYAYLATGNPEARGIAALIAIFCFAASSLMWVFSLIFILKIWND